MFTLIKPGTSKPARIYLGQQIIFNYPIDKFPVKVNFILNIYIWSGTILKLIFIISTFALA